MTISSGPTIHPTFTQESLPIKVPRYTQRRNRSRARLHEVREASIGELVLDFHEAFNLPRNSQPTLEVSSELAALRLRLLAEESEELGDAIERGNLVAVADALADITYVIFGTAISYGIDLEAVIREVHRSNMSKLDCCGRPIKREDGKVLKSDRYEPPEINAVLAVQPPLF